MFILEIMDFNENHYSVRQKIGVPGSKSIRNIFPLHPVTSKRPESPYGAKYCFFAENPVFQFFGLEIPYRTRVKFCQPHDRTNASARGPIWHCQPSGKPSGDCTSAQQEGLGDRRPEIDQVQHYSNITQGQEERIPKT